MSRALDTINELEKEYGIELDGSFDTLSILCDHEGCRHSDCDCWDDFRNAVQRQLKQQKYRGSISVHDLKEIMAGEDKYVDPDAAVFINDLPIHEAWFDGTAFHITTREVACTKHLNFAP